MRTGDGLVELQCLPHRCERALEIADLAQRARQIVMSQRESGIKRHRATVLRNRFGEFVSAQVKIAQVEIGQRFARIDCERASVDIGRFEVAPPVFQRQP